MLDLLSQGERAVQRQKDLSSLCSVTGRELYPRRTDLYVGIVLLDTH